MRFYEIYLIFEIFCLKAKKNTIFVSKFIKKLLTKANRCDIIKPTK